MIISEDLTYFPRYANICCVQPPNLLIATISSLEFDAIDATNQHGKQTTQFSARNGTFEAELFARCGMNYTHFGSFLCVCGKSQQNYDIIPMINSKL